MEGCADAEARNVASTAAESFVDVALDRWLRHRRYSVDAMSTGRRKRSKKLRYHDRNVSNVDSRFCRFKSPYWRRRIAAVQKQTANSTNRTKPCIVFRYMRVRHALGRIHARRSYSRGCGHREILSTTKSFVAGGANSRQPRRKVTSFRSFLLSTFWKNKMTLKQPKQDQSLIVENLITGNLHQLVFLISYVIQLIYNWQQQNLWEQKIDGRNRYR